MSPLQAMTTGAIAGALVRSDPLHLGVDLCVDENGNYTNEIIVEGLVSGEEIHVFVVTAEEAERIKKELA